MGRYPSLRILATVAALAPASGALAAELTRVVSSADVDKPFGLDFSVRYDRIQHSAKILQEGLSSAGYVQDLSELKYSRTANVITPRLAIGLYRDLELHVEVPYVLSDDAKWSYAANVDATNSIIDNIGIDANGTSCGGACPIFPVGGGGTTVYRGRALGDFKVGVAWGILSEKRDDTKPTWVVGLDVTLPTAAVYDPSTSLLHTDKNNPAPVGRKIWQYDAFTALSRQYGPVDPYVRIHASFPVRSGTTYSNCDHATVLAANAPPQPQMTAIAPANCQDPFWKTRSLAQPPTIYGMKFGTELVAYESKADAQRVAFDLRVGADWTSSSRWYNELTDATGKLMSSERYVTLDALFGFYLRTSSLLHLQAVATVSHDRDHYLSGESLGPGSGNYDPAVIGTSRQNPNFDFRYDLPGRRFRVSETTVFTLSAALTLNF
jgi:hypothetical protein